MINYKELASKVTDMVNTYAFDYMEFCKHLWFEHRTLQQNFTRLCFAWIRHCASEEYGKTTDGRNEATHKACRELVSTMDKANPDWDHLPMI